MNLSGLDDVQKEAVRQCEGPSLIVAGAGSGKTRVLTYRIAYLLDSGVNPGTILALTFTNKASKEMKERIASLVGDAAARRLWMGTFHSIFIKCLRQYADRIGFTSSFTIYDSSDTQSALRQCIKELQLDDKVYKPKEVASRISKAKNSLVSASAYKNNPAAVENDRKSRKGLICDIYELYSKKCRNACAMDFDDVLYYMNVLLRDCPDVCEELQERFSYILVDEYQDTNLAQYLIVKKLAGSKHNISVVGDDSQSIYGFRGARIQNILNFKRDFPESKEFRLEQNYRSTQTIVNAANSVISHNVNRLPKTCFSSGNIGEKIAVLPSFSEQDEAYSVVNAIVSRIYSSHASYSDFAILYRKNAQSRLLEEALRKRNLPYRIFAGHSFYERSEIKDMTAYFRLVVNHDDDEAFRRIVNVPARAIGETTVLHLAEAAKAAGCSLWKGLSLGTLADFGLKDAAVRKLRAFADMIAPFGAMSELQDAYSVAMAIVRESGMMAFLASDTSIEGQARMANVEELLNGIQEFVAEQSELAAESGAEEVVIKLSDYLENIALMTDYEAAEKKDDMNRIALMTVHSSKGLEFPYVFIVGMEEQLFPSGIDESEIEEERRLFYVALTRAEVAATVSFARSRNKWGGERVSNPPSRFLYEIDEKCLDAPIRRESGLGNTVSDGMSSFRSFTPRPAAVVPPRTASVHIPAGDFVPVDPDLISEGQRIEHKSFGFGKVISAEGRGVNKKLTVEFENVGRKTLLMKYAQVRLAD